MRTIQFKLIAMMITLATVISGLSAEAQRRSDRDNNSRVKKSNVQHDKDHSNTSYSRRHSSNSKHDKHSNNKNWNKSQNKHYAHSNKFNHQEYKYHNNHKWDGHHKSQTQYYYKHPQHGVVYRKFSHAPVRFKYHDRDYYYCEGHYYRHYHGIGYVRVELPGLIIIKKLPEHHERFCRNNHEYFKSGDLVFERYDHGYRLVPNVSIQFTARF